MARLGAIVAIAPAFLLPTAALCQEQGDLAHGRAFAQEVCTPCHQVIPQQFALRIASAPSFAAIAATPGMTEMALKSFLASPHPTMPNLVLERQEAADVVAYILSLAPESRAK
jgi:mono/diheme cytochrome c family protein